MSKIQRCACGCGRSFESAREGHLYASDACKKRARRKGAATRKEQVGGDEAGAEIKRLWGDAPVTDAKKDLRVFLAPEDLKGAERKNPAACAFARACRRLFHSSKVLFFRSVAFVEVPDEKGVARVERFIMPSAMRRLVESFDRGEEIIPKGGFLLQAPSSYRSLEYTRQRNREHAAKAAERQKLLGERVETPSPAPAGQGRRYQDKPLVIDLAVRNGSGAVHFTRRKTS